MGDVSSKTVYIGSRNLPAAPNVDRFDYRVKHRLRLGYRVLTIRQSGAHNLNTSDLYLVISTRMVPKFDYLRLRPNTY